MSHKAGRNGRKSTRIIRDVILCVIISICAIVVICELAVIIRTEQAGRMAAQEYDKLKDYVSSGENDPDGLFTANEDMEETEPEPYDEPDDEGEEEEFTDIPRTYPRLAIDHSALMEINPDYIGWIYIPALDLSYPVVQETFADQYLYTTFEGVPNYAGCLFMDDVSDRDFNGFYDFIFGHNMNNGSMFGALRQLHAKGKEYLWREEPDFYIYRADKIMRYYIYAYYITENGSPAYDEIYSQEAYDQLVEYTIENSYLEKPNMELFENYPEILTLSTCSGRSGGSQRFVVHAVKTATWSNE